MMTTIIMEVMMAVKYGSTVTGHQYTVSQSVSQSLSRVLLESKLVSFSLPLIELSWSNISLNYKYNQSIIHT
jgi:hypothetical protein